MCVYIRSIYVYTHIIHIIHIMYVTHKLLKENKANSKNALFELDFKEIEYFN